ncbi:MAG: hypothetical protein MJ138_03005 [Kiritimatiellae bacterium]|nr:hypothetical protein [Kiritimatiellia bacterium]
MDSLLDNLESDKGAAAAKPAAKDEKKAEPKEEVAEAEEAPAEEEKKAEPKEEVAEAEEAPAEDEEKAESKEDVAEGEGKEEDADVAEAKKAVEETMADVKAQIEKSQAAAASAAEKDAAADDDELVSELMANEEVRREALDKQALREIAEARKALAARDWDIAYVQYTLAEKHLNDRPGSVELKKECATGRAEARFQGAKQALLQGERSKAKKYAEEARSLRHQRVGALLLALERDDSENLEKDLSEVFHVRNDAEYKADRDMLRKRLRNAAQYLSIAKLDKALEECELVIRYDPYNAEALALRKRIQRRREVILDKEREATRRGMIADVGKAWRPVYAVNAAELKGSDAATAKTPLDQDPVRSQEQSIEKRMQEMILPSISFKPPATLGDAVDYFRDASRDYDKPEIPIDQRGFNFVLNPGTQMFAKAGAEASEDDNSFAAGAGDEAAGEQQSQLPLIPPMSAANVSLWNALKLVCDVTGFKFKVQGPVVMLMPKDMTTDDLVTRSYNVTENFAERMSGAASEVQDLKGGANFNGGKDEEEDADQESSWKTFFALMGVEWPKNSRIVYIKTIGKLRVTNTEDNLSKLEQALSELNVTPVLIEIETRFVEVSQEDLNSLGFEWLLNSDYSLNLNNKLGKVLGVRGYAEKAYAVASDDTYGMQEVTDPAGGVYYTSVRGPDQTVVKKMATSADRFATINAVDGSAYSTGHRYLSTQGNPISGQGNSTNDRFMKINAFFGSADLSMILHMLSQRSDTDLLSAPKVVTRTGEEAIIKVVTEYRYPQDYDVTVSSSSSSGSSNNSNGSSSQPLAVVEPQNFETREVGVILQVTPTVSAEGQMINLDLHPQVVSEPEWHNYGMKIPYSANAGGDTSAITGIFTDIAALFDSLKMTMSDALKEAFASQAMDAATTALENANGSSDMAYYDVPMEQPFFKMRSIETHMSIYNGATVVMGGLITEERKSMEDKIPFLGDIPWLGRFFRSRSEYSNKRNLLIFVTARLVDPRGRQVSMGTGDDIGNVTDDMPVAPAPEP